MRTRTAVVVLVGLLMTPGGFCTLYNYTEVLNKSILFYEAQRSGKLPENRTVRWRYDSALNDRGVNNEDLTGGWYDAGDHVKFGFPQAFAVSVLAWGLLEYQDSYVESGLYEKMLDCIRWPLEYFIKAHPSKYVFYGQVGEGTADHNYWGRAENMTMQRPAFMINATNPGSDLAGLTAAAMALGSVAFRAADPQFSTTLLQHAIDLYDFATNYIGEYIDAITDAAKYYSTRGYKDELCWAAVSLYLATGNSTFHNDAWQKYLEIYSTASFGRGRMHLPCKIMLYKMSNNSHTTLRNEITKYFNSLLNGTKAPFTPKGLIFIDNWGSLRHAAQQAFIALLAADQGIVNVTKLRDFAKNQIGYALGDTGRSFVVGFGSNYPVRPHHRSASCPQNLSVSCTLANRNLATPNPSIIYGGLVGGPNATDQYLDDRLDYTHNEVAIDYNAGFQSALAGLLSLQLRGLF